MQTFEFSGNHDVKHRNRLKLQRLHTYELGC